MDTSDLNDTGMNGILIQYGFDLCRMEGRYGMECKELLTEFDILGLDEILNKAGTFEQDLEEDYGCGPEEFSKIQLEVIPDDDDDEQKDERIVVQPSEALLNLKHLIKPDTVGSDDGCQIDERNILTEKRKKTERVSAFDKDSETRTTKLSTNKLSLKNRLSKRHTTEQKAADDQLYDVDCVQNLSLYGFVLILQIKWSGYSEAENTPRELFALFKELPHAVDLFFKTYEKNLKRSTQSCHHNRVSWTRYEVEFLQTRYRVLRSRYKHIKSLTVLIIEHILSEELHKKRDVVHEKLVDLGLYNQN